MHGLATATVSRWRAGAARLVLGSALLATRAAAAWDWQIDVTPSGELFPALQLSQAARAQADGGGDGLVSVRFSGSDLPASVHVRVATPGLRAPAEVAARAGDGRLEVHPRLDWDAQALHSLAANRTQMLDVTVQADGGAAQTRSVRVRLHPLDDALYFVREGGDRVDLGWAFAGYVDPGDAVVDAVLAMARAGDPRFDAATTGVARKVAAVWDALQARGLRYAVGNPALSRGPDVYSQRVRLLGEVWRERRANCIDSSVLIASVLERLGIDPSIVLVPGHAFVGFRSGPSGDAIVHLETTLLGARGDSGFAAAERAGRQRWRSVAAKLDGRHAPDYAVVDIAVARRYGIVPIGAARMPDEAAAPAALRRGQAGPP